MRIINLVDRLDKVNFGIWNAAIATARELERDFGQRSEIWYPVWTRESEDLDLNGAEPRALDRLDLASLDGYAREAGLNPGEDVIVSHGCWQYPTRWGKMLKGQGFAWLAVPHGMLESWSLSQKRFRKWIYYRMVEKRALWTADRIRAVGKPEFTNLEQRFGDKMIWIPNGVRSLGGVANPPEKPPLRTVLFMARLHHKKGLLPLVQGWKASRLCNDDRYRLVIAGPDDGELPALNAFLRANKDLRNVDYVGPVYGADKEQLLRESRFYILPSHSEGFPTSVLEAMQNGLVPLISGGCNFPEVLTGNLAIRVEPDTASVRDGLNRLPDIDEGSLVAWAKKGADFIEKHYTYATIAARQAELHTALLGRTPNA